MKTPLIFPCRQMEGPASLHHPCIYSLHQLQCGFLAVLIHQTKAATHHQGRCSSLSIDISDDLQRLAVAYSCCALINFDYSSRGKFGGCASKFGWMRLACILAFQGIPNDTFQTVCEREPNLPHRPLFSALVILPNFLRQYS